MHADLLYLFSDGADRGRLPLPWGPQAARAALLVTASLGLLICAYVAPTAQ